MIAAIATAIVSSLLVCIRLHALNFPSAQDATPARQVSVAVVSLVSQRNQLDDWTWCIKRALLFSATCSNVDSIRFVDAQEALPLEKISIALAEGRWVSQPSGSLSVAIEVKDSADPTPAETSAGASTASN